MYLLRLACFICGIMLVIAGAMCVFMASSVVVPFAGMIVGVIMTTYSYVFAEFKD